MKHLRRETTDDGAATQDENDGMKDERKWKEV